MLLAIKSSGAHFIHWKSDLYMHSNEHCLRIVFKLKGLSTADKCNSRATYTLSVRSADLTMSLSKQVTSHAFTT